MTWRREAGAMLAVLAISCGLTGPPRGPLVVTYLANEGFMVEAAGRRVLLDALFREGVDGYATLSPGTRARLESAAAPFGDAAFVLATHFHADHFDAEAVAAYLEASPGTRFVSTPQALQRLASLSRASEVTVRADGLWPAEGRRAVREHRGVRVQALNIHHGRTRPVENLGLLVELGGSRLLHLGDSQATAADLRTAGATADQLDVVFVPYWYLTDDDGKQAVREIDARHIVVMHAAAPDIDGTVRAAGGFRALFEGMKKAFPNAVWLEHELDRIEF